MLSLVMALFDEQISKIQGNVARDVSALQVDENTVLMEAIAALKRMLESLLSSYTIEIKAVKSMGVTEVTEVK